MKLSTSTTDRAPTSIAEYNERYARNNRIEGVGFEVKTIAPCPFCAAADFLAIPILDTESALARESTCRECGRAGKCVFEHDATGTSFEFVQTGGADVPAWYAPKPRRA